MILNSSHECKSIVTSGVAMNCIYRKKFHTEMRPQKWLIFGSGDAFGALILSPIVHLGPRSSAGHVVVAAGVSRILDRESRL